MTIDKFLYPKYPLRCIITGPCNSGKSMFLTKLILKIFNQYDKIYIYSPSLHQDLYQKIIKGFINYIPIHLIPNILNEEDIYLVFEKIVNNEDFQKSDTEIETYESIDEKNFPQENEDGGILILDDLNEKEMIDPRVQAMFKRSRHSNLSIYIPSQDYYEIFEKTIWANGNIYHIFKPNNFLDVRKIYQKKTSMDMTFDGFNFLTFTCWNETYQPLTSDMTKDKYAGDID